MNKVINLSVSSVDERERLLNGATIISVGPAKGHVYNGLPVYADEKSLQMVSELINANNGKAYVNIDHSDKVGSKIGRILQAAVSGGVVVATMKFLDVAFTDALNHIGGYIFSVAKDDSDLIGCSLEMETDYEVIEDKAFLRPVAVNGVSIVNDPAFITKLAIFNKQYINTIQEKESLMENEKTDKAVAEVVAVEPKKEDLKTVEAVAASEDDKVAPVDVKPQEEAKPVEAKAESAVEPSLTEIAGKIDALQGLLAPLVGMVEEMKALKQTLQVKPDESKAEKTELSSQKQTVKLSATSDIEVVDDGSGTEKLDLQRIKTDRKYYAEHKNEYFAYLRKASKGSL